MRATKMRLAMKRQTQRFRRMVVLGLWMETINQNVRTQANRQISDRDRPTTVITIKSLDSKNCWEREKG